MSESEIHYLVPEPNRESGDTEVLLNAMGEYQQEAPFWVKQEVKAAEEPTGSVMLRLVRTSLHSIPRYALLEQTEKMRAGVERQISAEDRERLSRLFVGIAIAGATETE